MPTGLIRREGGRYSTRRRIPLDLVPSYGGKAEIVRALRTSTPDDAKRLHALMWVALDEEFAAARAALKEQGLRPAPVPPPKRRSWTPAQRAEWQRKRDEYEQGDMELQWEHAFDDYDNIPPARLEVEQAVSQARQRWEDEAAEARAERKRTTRAKGIPDAVALSVIVDKWEAERTPGLAAATRTRKIVERFEAVNGKLAVQAVTKQHVLALKDALIEEGQTASNTNVLIGMLGTILIYAMDKLHLTLTNPAARIRVADKRRAKDKRREFDEAALKAIFESRVYRDGLRPDAGGGEAAYWLPLLALYTGARQTELGQLHPDDIAQETYRDTDDKEQSAWVVRIVENAERGQTVKNEGSERRVPIHADLIALGFLKVAADAKAKGRSRIFHEITPNSVGVLMGNWSKWFGRYRRKECGLMGKDTPFHSFRHSFKHYARLATIPNEIHNEFTGHETGDVADTYGGLSYPLHPLVEGMKRYRVPGFKLPPPSPGLPGPFER